MPRYFFHVRDEDQVHADREGMELPDLHAALEEVFRAIRELRLDPPGRPALAFIVADSTGRTLLVIPVREDRPAHPLHLERGAERERYPGTRVLH